MRWAEPPAIKLWLASLTSLYFYPPDSCPTSPYHRVLLESAYFRHVFPGTYVPVSLDSRLFKGSGFGRISKFSREARAWTPFPAATPGASIHPPSLPFLPPCGAFDGPGVRRNNSACWLGSSQRLPRRQDEKLSLREKSRGHPLAKFFNW